MHHVHIHLFLLTFANSAILDWYQEHEYTLSSEFTQYVHNINCIGLNQVAGRFTD